MDWLEVLLKVLLAISLIMFVGILVWAGCCAANNLYNITHKTQNPPTAQIYGGEI